MTATRETDDFTYALLLGTAREAGRLAGALGWIIATADADLAVYGGPGHADALRRGLAEISAYAARHLAAYEAASRPVP